MATSELSPLLVGDGFISYPWEDEVPRPLACAFDGIPAARSGWTFWHQLTRGRQVSAGAATLRAVTRAAAHFNPDHFLVDSLFPYAQLLDCANAPFHGRVTVLGITLPNWGQNQPAKKYPLLILCPPQFEVASHLLKDPLVSYVEPSCIWPTFSSERTSLPSRSFVLATSGTQGTLQSDFIGRLQLVDRLAQSNPAMDFLVSVSSKQATILAERGALTAKNLLMRTCVPQRFMLRHAAAFITHGGLSSLKEAILEGVPTIVLPEFFDQPFNGMRIVHHGLGSALFSGEVSIDGLKGCLEAALSDAAMRERIYRMKNCFTEAEQHPMAAQLIESRL